MKKQQIIERIVEEVKDYCDGGEGFSYEDLITYKEESGARTFQIKGLADAEFVEITSEGQLIEVINETLASSSDESMYLLYTCRDNSVVSIEDPEPLTKEELEFYEEVDNNFYIGRD